MSEATRQRISNLASFYLCVFLPLLVIPQFLNFAHEAKTVGLLAFLAMFGLYTLFSGNLIQHIFVTIFRVEARYWLLISSFVVVLIIGLLNSTWPRSSLYHIRNFAIAAGCATICVQFVDRKKFICFLFVGSASIATLGLLQIVFNIQALVPSSDPGQFPAVTFGNRGLAALFVALGVAPGWHIWRTHSHKRLLIGAGLSLQGLFVLVTMTRSVWLGLLVGAITIYWIIRRTELSSRHPERSEGPQNDEKRWFFGGLLTLVAICATIIWLNPNLRFLLFTRFDPANWLQNPRFALWTSLIGDISRSHWPQLLFGHGAGSFQWMSAHHVHAGHHFLDAHNDYIQWILEYGIVGFTLITFAITSMLIAKIKNLRLSFEEGQWVLIFNMLVLLVAGLLLYPMQLSYFLTMFLVFSCWPNDGSPSRIAHHSRSFNNVLYWPNRISAALLIALFTVVVWHRVSLEVNMKFLAHPGRNLNKYFRTQEILKDKMNFVPVPFVYRSMIEPLK